jgi:hypothetical protein
MAAKATIRISCGKIGAWTLIPTYPSRRVLRMSLSITNNRRKAGNMSAFRRLFE